MSKRAVKIALGFVAAAICFTVAWVAGHDPGSTAAMACGAFVGAGVFLVALSSGFIVWLTDD